MFQAPDLPLIALSATAAVIDWRSRRIPNWLNLVIVIAGVGASCRGYIAVTPAVSILGIVCGFFLLFPAFALGAMGGGDVKMLAAVGAWAGPIGVLIVLIAATVAGAIIAICQAVYTGKLPALLHNSGILVLNLAHARSVGADHIEQTGKSFRSIDRPLPYAVAILAGVLFWCGWF